MSRTRTPRSHLVLTAVAAATLALPLAVPAAAAPVRDSYLIKPVGPAADLVFPEGVATDGTAFFVGSTTDGTVYRGSLAGRVATPFLPGGTDGRTSLTGLKVDDGDLLAAGAATGRFFVYDIESRDLVGSYQVQPAPSTAVPSFLNDETVTPDGTTYVTDSQRRFLYRVGPDRATDGVVPLEVWLDFGGTPLEYTAGFNVNGIASSPDGRYLVLAKSNTADLWRVDVATKQVTKIDLGGAAVSGDGLVLDGSTLYAIERQIVAGQAEQVGFVVKVQLSDDLTSGTVVSRTTDPSFDDPTTAALVRGRLLVVNSQFGERGGAGTLAPFTVSSVPAP
jgi:sugar lactone lactonase YvrE